MEDRRLGTSPRPDGTDGLEEVAHGGFASVYRAWQPAFHRWVAVKVLTAHGSPPGRFEREVQALGALSEHPHVVPVYDAGEIDGRPYIVMPYLTGGSLHDRIGPSGMDPGQAVAAGAAVADALEEAHRAGILHRDIKPGNILFTAYGVPQLADFGLARVGESTLTTGMVAATVAYAPPEVLSGNPATPRSDVYSLGATLYAALRGEPAFLGREGEPAVALAMRVLHEAPAPLEWFGVPPGVAAVVHRAMAKDPDERQPSAAHLRDELRRSVQAPRPLSGVRPAQPARRGPARPRRALQPVLAGAAAAILLVTAVVAAVSVGRGNSRAHSAAAPRPVAAAPAPPPATSAPSTTAPVSKAAADQPPSAGGATNVAGVAPGVLASEITSYYGLVNAHQLDTAWQWLTPGFQQRIGEAYYHQFWNSIGSVHVLEVSVAGAVARVTLHYRGVNGVSSTETSALGFAVAQNRVLIDGQQA